MEIFRELYRNHLRLVLSYYKRTFGDLSELSSTRELIKLKYRNQYSGITIEEITKRINELSSNPQQQQLVN